uniref:HMG box domain-containing protein n=1 Tax=Globodera pallida TaxID=36090 RepID=A0A183BNZ7_GLOPA
MAEAANTWHRPELNDDERLIHYQQEFRRYKKLLDDEAERPLHVQLSERTTNAIRDSLKSRTKRQPPSPTGPRRRKRPSSRKQPAGAAEAASSSTATTYTTAERSRSTSSNNSDSSAVEGKDEQQKQQREAPGSSAAPSSSSTATAQQRSAPHLDIEEAERARQAAMEYATQNPGLLNIGGAEGTQILRLARGAYRPVKGSNLLTLLNYHFTARNEEGEAVGKAPPGYTTFMRNARDDLRMWRLLFPASAPQSGSTSSTTAMGTRSRRRHPQQPKMGGQGTGCLPL